VILHEDEDAAIAATDLFDLVVMWVESGLMTIAQARFVLGLDPSTLEEV
jgi:hypothetical protein